MSDWGSPARTVPQQQFIFSPATLPVQALAGVRRRRIFAICLDFLLVAFIAGLIWTVLFFLTLGLILLLLPPIFPFIAFFYNGLTVSGWRMATPGMLAMDLEMRMTDGSRVPFLNAAVHAVLLYISWMFPPILLVSLLTDDKRCLHDILAGVIVTRRAPSF
ncbi:RDD family protein [Beijerinckia indica]|uniref:RDD domain containing protein n=1 Tax=Beijerinckia indica subsp. indica (strain ATCC 9039 / DSM 1715 / NCIMB 8712) TaxID=395963 RepID=B2IJ84_BEII9|nr:RDD family protein [Beijerinckia indica]ACB94847.1 RDD domain containing protein [Beijerinckia indica subsp. indica ATCC 9039]